jgi:N-acetyl-anhydromuramoyl-L-alanine amidase
MSMRGGWLSKLGQTVVRQVHSVNFDERPVGAAVELLVIHYICLPLEQYVGDGVERLFTNQLRPDDPNADLASVSTLRVSAHFFIRRHGQVMQFVSCDQRAWHAGVSMFKGRERCNDFSIGIELEGSSLRPFTNAQYRRLALLVAALRAHYPLRFATGHEHIAPGRKQDPGPYFDWERFAQQCGLPHS